ncbi:protein of unknown function [Candidatus Nitrosotalea okcheonensis]|uniref:Uncharacterized protein n=1 Tax=Candidatus Nitrosotalea okcheonensis TaxID=1903276 RepID=A0A2H1FCM2_9ARCH|nr:protein of unknown function [Candidatus Nitrosotalea okcheonensis]
MLLLNISESFQLVTIKNVPHYLHLKFFFHAILRDCYYSNI